MKFLRSFIKDWIGRWHTVWNKDEDSERRVFAALEFVLIPISFLTLIGLGVQFAIEKSGTYTFPLWWTDYATQILSSAAIGYLTNWIAIEMIFKPFEREPFHPLHLIGWKQGLVPKNKEKIAKTLGEEVKGKLLNPDKIAEELCQMIESVVKKPETQERLCAQFQTIVRQNEQNIINFIAPRIETAIEEQFDNLVKPETVMEFWSSSIEPKLKADETRKMIAQKITDGLKRRSPQIIEMVREEVRKAIVNYISNMPFIGSSATTIANAIIQQINWNNWEDKLNSKLASEDTQSILRDEVLNLVTQFNAWFHSDEAKDKITPVISSLREKLRKYLKSFLENNLPEMAHSIFSNEGLAKWLRESLLPKAVPFFKVYMQKEGKDLIVQKLDIAHRIEDAVNKQDMEQFYNMINSVAAKHLGAIQVLGYVIGAVIGALQAILI